MFGIDVFSALKQCKAWSLYRQACEGTNKVRSFGSMIVLMIDSRKNPCIYFLILSFSTHSSSLLGRLTIFVSFPEHDLSGRHLDIMSL